MNRKVLIISPYFPPVNAADMQRIRMSLPYFKLFNWYAEVVTVQELYSDLAIDNLLLQSVDPDIIVHKIKALNKKWTSKVGLGSIALRSFFFYLFKVNKILKEDCFDLIYFSTTQFPVCILGAYWKKIYNIPYIIDMQDPWHSEYYKSKPKNLQPSKYWFSYNLNKYLEPIALKNCGGLISVSGKYLNDLKARYLVLETIPESTIPFGHFEKDLEIAKNNKDMFKSLLNPCFKNLVYIGRGGADMHKAIIPVFEVLRSDKKSEFPQFQGVQIYFIGTSYAAPGKGIATIASLAKAFDIEEHVIELTDRISYYHTLNTLIEADALFIPGSDDPGYTASKIYPYLISNKPLLAIFNSNSSTVNIFQEFGLTHNYTYDRTEDIDKKIATFLYNLVNESLSTPVYAEAAKKKYSAKNMTKLQCYLFNQVLHGKN